MTTPTFKTVTRTQGNNQALKEGAVKPKGFVFEFEEVHPLVRAFRQMVRELAYDICEMALTTYVCAREHGVRFTALPIFLVRGFHHRAIVYNRKSQIRTPRDLEGKKVGVSRGYTVTTGVWARGILQEQYGVDLNKVTWVLSGDEHVLTYQAPSNVVSIESGETIEGQLLSGELAGAVNFQSDYPDIVPMIADPFEAGFEAMCSSGFYPINHLIVIRNDLLESHPALPNAVFEAFAESKRIYLNRLRQGEITDPSPIDRLHQRVLDITDDPLPYGVTPNRPMLERLLAHARSQAIITKPTTVDELFVPSTLELIG